eukprot:GEMP01008409.1.p1 GENE.GEMP01008409.1~~GEMP01008409.1.p1  ORF type:complete len:711 (+),score=215.51 GEMP01008409.1:171-2303(+)
MNPAQAKSGGLVSRQTKDRVLQELKAEAEVLSKYYRGARVERAENIPPVTGKPLSSDVHALQLERQQLLEWGENLYREVVRLEREKHVVDKYLKQERGNAQHLEKVNQDLLDKVLILENFVACHDEGSTPLVSNQETVELRNQIGIYCKEINHLKSEKENAMTALLEIQDETRILKAECTSYTLSREEVARDFNKLQARYNELQNQLDVESDRKKSCEDRLRDAKIEVDVVNAALQRAKDVVDKLRTELTSVREQGSTGDQRLTDLAEVIKPLRELFLKTQAAFASQTKEYERFVMDVVARRKNAWLALHKAKEGMLAAEEWANAFLVKEDKDMLTLSDELEQKRLKEELDFMLQKEEFERRASAFDELKKKYEQEIRDGRLELAGLRRGSLTASQYGGVPHDQLVTDDDASWGSDPEARERRLEEQARREEAEREAAMERERARMAEEEAKAKAALESLLQEPVVKPKVSMVKPDNEIEYLQQKKGFIIHQLVTDKKGKTKVQKRKGVLIEEDCINFKKTGFTGMMPCGGRSSIPISDITAIRYGAKSPAFEMAPADIPGQYCFSLDVGDTTHNLCIPPDEEADKLIKALMLVLSNLNKKCEGRFRARGDFYPAKLRARIDHVCREKNIMPRELWARLLDEDLLERAPPLDPEAAQDPRVIMRRNKEDKEKRKAAIMQSVKPSFDPQADRIPKAFFGGDSLPAWPAPEP